MQQQVGQLKKQDIDPISSDSPVCTCTVQVWQHRTIPWYQNKVFDFTQEPHNTNHAVTNLKLSSYLRTSPCIVEVQ